VTQRPRAGSLTGVRHLNIGRRLVDLLPAGPATSDKLFFYIGEGNVELFNLVKESVDLRGLARRTGKQG
jgi:hypothetical protein